MTTTIILLVEIKRNFTLFKNNGFLLILALLLTFFLLMWVLYNPLKIKVKINNFYIAWLGLFIYLFIYIFLLLYLRIRLMGSTVNLREGVNKITNLFIFINNYSLYEKIIIYIIIGIILLIWVLLVIKLRNLLEYKIWQLFIYYKGTIPFFSELCTKVSYYFCYFGVIGKIQFNLSRIFRKKEIKEYKDLSTLAAESRVYMKKEKIYPTIIVFIIFFIEIITNNFNLYYIFYYLPYYIIIIIWIKMSDTYYWHDYKMGKIIIEMAYFFPDIIYVNLSSIDRLFLKAFIYKNEKIFYEWETICNPSPLVEYTFPYGIPIEKKSKFENPLFFGNPIEKKSKFEKMILENGKIIFHNEYRGLYFEEKDIKKDGEYYLVDDKKENYYT